MKIKKEENIKQNSGNKKTVSGLVWMFSGSSVQIFLQFLVNIFLARLLTPSEFGIAGMATIVISFSTIVSMVGVGQALIQRKVLNDAHINTAFTISIVINTILAVGIFFFSNSIATFFDTPKLGNVLEILSVTFVIQGVSTVAESLLQRKLEFKLIAKIQMASFLVYGFSGLLLAAFSYGYWSLVLASVLQITFKSLISIIKQPHSKKIKINISALKELLYFGGGLSLAKLSNQIALQGDNLIVGRFLGAGALGLYGRAYQLMVMPANLFGQVLNKVLFPSMSKLQSDNDRLKGIYEKGISVISILVLPLTVVFIVLAKEIILVLFGEKWVSLEGPFIVLSMGMLFRSSYKISDSLAKAKGAVYKRAWRQIIYATCIIFGAYIGSHWGILGVSIGVLIALKINYFMMAHLCIKIVKYKWRSFLLAHLPSVVLSTLVYVEINIMTDLFREHFSSILTLVFSLIVTLIWYLFILILNPLGMFSLYKDTAIQFLSVFNKQTKRLNLSKVK
ncbi:lipopolysaccharide biosynthesis protein [Halobacillus salinarum]|uniref:Lipopolysaccharide biosynthesis protein n=1 Tax=Halobacillus salinarum TaxID=2932257 RepID=A0ABY4EP53_9BACI|nr:lipopolysaccharide biosynthesis protein [Halobacillus salinarum]UOQ45392.1 lipopolysaccharide biosynthesis protein [Halobacillus salinarum]